MNEAQSIALLHDYIHRAQAHIVEESLCPPLQAVNAAVAYLLDDTVHDEALSYDDATLAKLKGEVSEVTFPAEAMRKAFRTALLEAFKSMRITNAQMTPDTIGMFMAYLMNKIGVEANSLVFDPLIGTSNLLATIHNHVSQAFRVLGVDDDPAMCTTARNMLDSLNIDGQVILQDTMTFTAPEVDVIVTDFPPAKVDERDIYLPYHTIIRHIQSLKKGGMMLAVIENDFFDQPHADAFKKNLNEFAMPFGLIKLHESLFKNHPKSIFLMRRKQYDNEQLPSFLLADLPAFSDKAAFNAALIKLEKWFAKKEGDVQ